MKISFPISLEELKFVLITDGCEGTCPVYKISISGNGKVEYEGFYFVRVEGVQRKEIDVSEVLKLFESAVELGIFTMESNYSMLNILSIRNNTIICEEEQWYDLPSTTTEIHFGKKVKKIYNYLGAPKRLIRFEKLLLRISGAKEWIE